MDSSSIVSGKTTLANSVSSVKTWISKRFAFENKFHPNIKRPDIIKLDIKNICNVDHNLFPVVIKHHFIDDFPGPTRLYGVTRVFDFERIRNILIDEHLYFCSENIIYSWNEKQNKYLETITLRNTDDGRY